MVEGYSLVNLRADWTGIFGSKVDLGAYVRNALDEEYTLEVLNLYAALGFDGRTIGEPRTYGVRVTYNFGGN
jgi:iron complex outermembrane receptor protein